MSVRDRSSVRSGPAHRDGQTQSTTSSALSCNPLKRLRLLIRIVPHHDIGPMSGSFPHTQPGVWWITRGSNALMKALAALPPGRALGEERFDPLPEVFAHVGLCQQ